jgi:hypothetical protein
MQYKGVIPDVPVPILTALNILKLTKAAGDLDGFQETTIERCILHH